MVDELANFDYVVLEDGNIFTVHGDRHEDDRILGFPTYRPSDDGGRVYGNMRLERYPRNPQPEPEASFYSESAVDPLLYTFPADAVVDIIHPLDPEKESEQLKAEVQKIFDSIRDEISDLGLDTYVIGSDAVGIAGDESDLDILVTGEDLDFEPVYRRLKRLNGLEPDEIAVDEKSEDYAERFGMPVDVARYLLETFSNKFMWNGEREIDIISGQPPGSWTEFHRPEPDEEYEEVESMSATITDASKSLYIPVRYGIETENGDSLDLLSYSFIWRSLEEGDEISVTGDLFPAADTIYLREKEHFVAPTYLIE